MTEIMVFTKEKKAIDDLLELAHDALHHCLSEEDVFLVLLDQKSKSLQGKIYTGQHSFLAEDLTIPLQDKKSLLVKALIVKQMVSWQATGTQSLSLPEIIEEQTNYQHALIAPLFSGKNVFGLFFAAKEEDFNTREELWFEQLIGQLNNSLKK